MTDATRRAAMAERAARAGGVVARESFREELRVDTKATKTDLVTDADHEAQQQVVATLQQEFPGDAFVCEEDATSVPGADDADYREDVPATGDAWVVDPIDGTTNFVRGIRFWATSVAAVVDGSPVGVATYMPAEGDIYTAGPESVTVNGSTMSVSERDDPETFVVGAVGWWPGRGGSDGTAMFRALAERFGDLRRFTCMQGELALVASGALDAAVMLERPHPWDAIAGVHLVRRAGGVATDLEGERWSPDATGLAVSNGECHDAVLEAATDALSVEQPN